MTTLPLPSIIFPCTFLVLTTREQSRRSSIYTTQNLPSSLFKLGERDVFVTSLVTAILKQESSGLITLKALCSFIFRFLRAGTSAVCQQIRRLGMRDVETLQGGMSQLHRDRVLDGFRNGKFSVLVATDVAARGLDIPDVELIVQVLLLRFNWLVRMKTDEDDNDNDDLKNDDGLTTA